MQGRDVIPRVPQAGLPAPVAPKQPELKSVAPGPFPKQTPEKVVCEVIANTNEKDLWVRFGHMLPLYQQGSVFILQGGDEQQQKDIWNLVVQTYGKVTPSYKTCGSKWLLYVKGLGYPEKEEPDEQGRNKSAFVKKLREKYGVTTLESHSWLADIIEKERRLAAYCREDAWQCEKLVGLLAQHPRDVLCSFALDRLRIFESSPHHKPLIQKCRERVGKPFACVKYSRTENERVECARWIRDELTTD